MRPSKSLYDLEASSVKKKWKDKAFAAGTDRTEMEHAAKELGIDIWEHVGNVIIAMRKISQAWAGWQPATINKRPAPIRSGSFVFIFNSLLGASFFQILQFQFAFFQFGFNFTSSTSARAASRFSLRHVMRVVIKKPTRVTEAITDPINAVAFTFSEVCVDGSTSGISVPGVGATDGSSVDDGFGASELFNFKASAKTIRVEATNKTRNILCRALVFCVMKMLPKYYGFFLGTDQYKIF